ncbi:hypothetical protein [Paenibacillus sp. DMB20]|uniref:hypothetical protein n=1 Tax=Paenibacillus sp. DMB20 TaxID=1642570 RepID=UPI0006280134|nr:hypothetical protein [Paenibacillus sp. DMB20]KKO54135.1 hypothetical protein XI25_08700 [Paenibacillus sp. DMB20]
MESNLHKKIQNKVKRWSKGFAYKERPYMYEESYTVIEKFLKSPKEKNDFISLGIACNTLSTWYCADFLERYLNKKGEYSYSLKQSMLWGTIDHLLYASGKMGDIKPIWYVDVCLSACNLLILQEVDKAHQLLEYASPEHIDFNVEPAESVCQFVNRMFSVFYKDKEISHEFPKPLNDIFTNLINDLMDETKKDIHASVNQACEFHLSRTKMYQEFDREDKMLLPSEILAPLLLRKRMGLEVETMEHPLIKDLFPVVEGLIEVDTDPVYLKIVEYI